MRTRTTTVGILAVLTLTLTACSSSDDSSTSATDTPKKTAASSPADAGTYDSAQDIADALKAAGLTVTPPEEETGDSYITQVGGTPYNFTVTDQDTAAGDAAINMFPNPEALAGWIPLSKQFGGVAVTGGTWAVSLPTRSETALADSKRLAPKIAEALDGTVQQ
jgi:hypothetical protein